MSEAKYTNDLKARAVDADDDGASMTPALVRCARSHARGIREGERRAEEKARATARGLVTAWRDARTRELSKKTYGTPRDLEQEWQAGFISGNAATYLACLSAARAAFGLTANDQPPTGGEPAPEGDRPRVPGVPGADSASALACCGRVECPHLETSTDADGRWQPGAVWEWTRPPHDRFTIEGTVVDDGRLYVRFVNVAEQYDAADMTEANGWRYVGPASEVAAVERDIANAPAAPARTGEANPGGAGAGAAGAGESVALDGGAYERLKDELEQLEAENANLRTALEQAVLSREEYAQDIARLNSEVEILKTSRDKVRGERDRSDDALKAIEETLLSVGVTPQDEESLADTVRRALEERGLRSTKVERVPQACDVVLHYWDRIEEPAIVRRVRADGSLDLWVTDEKMPFAFGATKYEPGKPRENNTWRFRD